MTLDFGYPWWLTYWPLVPLAAVLLLLLLGFGRKWSKLTTAFLGVALVYFLAAFVIARFVLNINGRGTLPTQQFLSSGAGRVLDMGAGTGRSSIMVLEGRPHTTLVALDLFEDSYREHFGNISGQKKLLSNFKAAGVENRATIQPGDMRKLPFEPATFDGIISAYAIDHLGRTGSVQCLQEASRVLKPGGEFLLMVIAKEFWLKLAYGPAFLHFGVRGADWWSARMQEAGFQVVETGVRPATLYLLARKNLAL